MGTMRRDGRDEFRIREIRWLILARTIFYLAVIAFVLQNEFVRGGAAGGYAHSPLGIIVTLAILNLASLAAVPRMARTNALEVVLFAMDLVGLTWLILATGGYNSVFISYYLIVILAAAFWLPRSYAALFASIATLGSVLVGKAHLSASMILLRPLDRLIPESFVRTLPAMDAAAVVSNTLFLSVSFFVAAYFAGLLSERLKTEQRLNRHILHSMAEGVAVMDSRGKTMYANTEFLRLFPESGDLSLRELSGLLFKDGREQEMLIPLFQGENVGRLFATREADGDRPPMEITITPLAKKENRLSGLVFMVSDLSLRKRAEEAEKSAERFRALSDMAAGLAHEIRNPLASVRSAIQEIGRDFPPSSPNRKLAEVVMSESDRLDGIISKFLKFSRQETLSLVRFRLGPLLEDVKILLERSRDRADAAIGLNVADDPEILCDPPGLKDVFINLGLNALQAMRGSGRLDIECRLSSGGGPERDGGLEVTFSDSGPGLFPGMEQAVFEPFFSGRPGGTGLGLSLSRKVVESHGGKITTANKPSGGSIFSVWLPPADSTRASARLLEADDGTRVFFSWGAKGKTRE